MKLGINLGFATKRLPDARSWAHFVREELDLDLVQFTYDLIDPWTPTDLRRALAAEVRSAADEYGITIHSAFGGLATYTYNGMLHPHEAAREAGFQWWKNAIQLATELGCTGIGGQLGALSTADGQSPDRMKERYEEGFRRWTALSRLAADAGLETLYIEPTPLTRENPHTIAQAQEMAAYFDRESALPVQYAFDIGHAIYKPLYGDDASVVPWLDAVGDHIGLFHVQNTDGMSDSHWGWPDARGTFDLRQFGEQLRARGLDDRPVFLEVFYAYELADQAVFDSVISSVAHCKRELLI